MQSLPWRISCSASTVSFRELTRRRRPQLQSLLVGLGATVVTMAALSKAAPALMPSGITATACVLLPLSLGMAWVATVVGSGFWRVAVLVGALLQIPLTAHLSSLFEKPFAPWALGVSLLLAWGVPEYLRYSSSRRQTGDELDPSFYDPSPLLNPPARSAGGVESSPAPAAPALETTQRTAPNPERVSGSILFCELANHNELADYLPPEDAVRFINRLLGAFEETSGAHGGRADRADGEAFRAVFCSAYGAEEHAEAAMTSALAIRERASSISRDCELLFGMSLDVRMGVNSGEVLLAEFGSETSKRAGIAGETAEWARRLAGANVLYGSRILIGSRTGLIGGHTVERRPIDLLQRHLPPHPPEEVFEVLALQNTLDASEKERLRHYREGVSKFRARKWEDARHSLLAARPSDHSDDAIDLLLLRIDEQKALSSLVETEN
jgi:class 3 adenylate cyclase